MTSQEMNEARTKERLIQTHQWINEDTMEMAIESTKYPTEKSGYERRWTFGCGNIQWVVYWNGLNIGRGYKARLVTIDRFGKRKVVARKWS